MSLLAYNSTPAERFRFCSFADNLESDWHVQENGGTISGSPLIDFGATFDGASDYITYRLQGHEFYSTKLSIVIEFYPDFDYDDGAAHYLFDSTNGARYLVFKNTLNQLLLYLGNTPIATVSSATLGSVWRQNEKNTILISGTSGNTSMWFNGVNVVNKDATVWTPSAPTELYIGSSFSGGQLFDGKITSVKVFKSLLTAQDAAAYYNNTMYAYMDDAVLHLPMLAAQHDPSSNRTLDVSGNGNHATFGDGSTSSTFPTKLTKRGYSTDGGDYLKTGTGLFTDTGFLTMACLFELQASGFQSIFSISEGNTDIGGLIQWAATPRQFAFYCGGGGVNDRALSYALDSSRGIHSVIGVYDGTNTMLYLDGVKGTNALTPQPPGLTSSMSGYIGVLGNLSQYTVGNIYECQAWDYALSSIQVKDLHIQMMREINNV